MTGQKNSTPAAAAKSSHQGKKTVGSAAAAVTLAAVTVLSATGLMGAPSTGLDSASIISSPPNSASSRIAGVKEDMARAVALQQITPEQAAFLERQLVQQIQKSGQTA